MGFQNFHPKQVETSATIRFLLKIWNLVAVAAWDCCFRWFSTHFDTNNEWISHLNHSIHNKSVVRHSQNTIPTQHDIPNHTGISEAKNASWHLSRGLGMPRAHNRHHHVMDIQLSRLFRLFRPQLPNVRSAAGQNEYQLWVSRSLVT